MTNKEVGDELVASIDEAIEFLKGNREPARVYAPPNRRDVARIRSGLGLTQAEFAEAFGISLGSVRDWEQGRCYPDSAADTLLLMIEREPETVRRILRSAA